MGSGIIVGRGLRIGLPRQTGTHRIEIHIDHTCQSHSGIQERSTREAALPEMTGASVLQIGSMCDLLLDQTEQPAWR